MNSSGLSQTQLRAWLGLGVWAVVGVGFGVVFFGWGGPEEFAGDRARIVAGAVAIACGYAGYLGVVWATGRRRAEVLADERDAQVVARASQVTLVIVVMLLFLVSVGLWEGYRTAGAVPVGWLWFMAYGAIITTFVVHALATLLVDARLGGHGRG